MHCCCEAIRFVHYTPGVTCPLQLEKHVERVWFLFEVSDPCGRRQHIASFSAEGGHIYIRILQTDLSEGVLTVLLRGLDCALAPPRLRGSIYACKNVSRIIARSRNPRKSHKSTDLLQKRYPNLSQGPLGALVDLAASWEPPGSFLAASWVSLGSILGASWVPSGCHLGASGRLLVVSNFCLESRCLHDYASKITFHGSCSMTYMIYGIGYVIYKI